jgi:DNA-binding response OmpR family regulator
MTEKPQGRNARVLVVDDAPDVLDLLETLLGVAGYDVRTVDNADEALLILEDGWPDVMLLDINMPKRDGFSLLKAIGERSLPRPPQILMVTARYAEQDVERARALGAADFLTKPFSNRTLLARVATLMSR